MLMTQSEPADDDNAWQTRVLIDNNLQTIDKSDVYPYSPKEVIEEGSSWLKSGSGDWLKSGNHEN